MTDSLPDTPVFGRQYCPTCEPDTDPIEEILEVRYCHIHGPSLDGEDDDAVERGGYMSGSGEVGGEDNKKWCDKIHRKL